MSRQSHSQQTIEAEAIKCEAIEGLKRAIDSAYRRVFRAAQHDWERMFAGKDPSNGCVSVHTRADGRQATAVRGSAFLTKRKGQLNGSDKLRLPRFAR